VSHDMAQQKCGAGQARGRVRVGRSTSHQRRPGTLLKRVIRLLAFAAIIGSCPAVVSARAQPRDSANAMPQMSASDRVVIERNELLRSIVDDDPALVRRVLDALGKADDAQTRSDFRQEAPPRALGSVEGTFDRSKNPDLDRLERSSPEAMNDLFQLLKQASARRQRPAR
jgi:hypothetical protein